MLKREHIKQAIDQIVHHAPEIGYSLDELFGAGRIDALPSDRAIAEDGDFLFLFNEQVVTVRRFLFINEGSAPIEQQLLIKYGEMLQKLDLYERPGKMDYRLAAEQTHYAGLEFFVDYEINLALESLGLSGSVCGRPHHAGIDCLSETAVCLLDMKNGKTYSHLAIDPTGKNDPREVFFESRLAGKVPAVFLPFPYCRQALVQLSELNMEFFSTRFVLNLLVRRRQGRLFACLSNGYLAGLVCVDVKQAYFHHALEICYLSTVRDRLPWLPYPPLRGVGSFLVAGVWMFWKTRCPSLRGLMLDSEIGATGFYDAIGFQRLRTYSYRLKRPRGHLLDHLIRMADACPHLNPVIVEQIAGFLERQVRAVARQARPDQEKAAFRAIRHSLLCRHHALLATTAANMLLAHRSRIPQADELLRIGIEFGRLRLPAALGPQKSKILIINDLAYHDHLESIFHMESSRRMQAVQSALDHPSVRQKWIHVNPRPASQCELAWVHSCDHIERIAATAGKAICSLDLDTQTTRKSYEIARLAVGGVFSLLDAIWNSEHRYGFAFVRPPGHHAEPERAMGFCLFNNIALAAHYLQKVYGLERIMIVDIDAHHGNGTQKAFYATDTVLFASLHQFPGFPGSGHLNETGSGRGEGFSVNIPLPKGSRDIDFAQAVYSIIRPIAQQYEPEAMLVSCGFDLYQHDRLAGMNGTPEGYALMTRFFKEIAQDLCGGRLIYILEGGYNLHGIETCALRTLQELSGMDTLKSERLETIRNNDPYKFPALRKAIQIQKKFWKTLKR